MKNLNVPKGTRDFSSDELRKRIKIIEIIRKNFELFGFSPIETPSFENLETLSGKYGEEGDRLIFKILDSGDFLKSSKEFFYELTKIKNEEDQKEFIERALSSRALLKNISHKALRYDLTIPFARYVMMHKNELTFPFKRYQIQPVWRADRPQKGRYREFYQCDADCIGSSSLWQEFEFIKLYDKVFSQLNLKVKIQLNHRGLLEALAKKAGVKDPYEFAMILDKWDKIGKEGVFDEMKKREFSCLSIEKIKTFLMLNELSFRDKLQECENFFQGSKEAQKALEELTFIFQKIEKFPLKTSHVEFDFTLARGLDYYTGLIFEVKVQGLSLSSIGGGGRYENLTKNFGSKEKLSAVGISFGLDRIYLAMEALGLFNNLEKDKEILFVNFGQEESEFAFKWIEDLRDQNLKASLYPDPIKLKKQFEYANKNQIPFVAILGEEEIKQNILKIKNLLIGEEVFCTNLEEVIKNLKSK